MRIVYREFQNPSFGLARTKALVKRFKNHKLFTVYSGGDLPIYKEDLAKVPKGLSLKEYYARIYNWHKKNKNTIFVAPGMSRRSRDDPYILCYLELVEVIPKPNVASSEDIAFICTEVMDGLMEWAYKEKDENGVKTAAYAQHILDTFFDGYGTKTEQLAQNSKLYPKYNMKSCVARYKK